MELIIGVGLASMMLVIYSGAYLIANAIHESKPITNLSVGTILTDGETPPVSIDE